MQQNGFKVLEVPEVLPAADPRYRWRRVNVFDFNIETHPNCPIDGTQLETIAALVGLSSGELLRCGCCQRCGLVGYIDRPSQADIDRYYAETWMGETEAQATAQVQARADSEPNLSVLSTMPVDRSTPVLEIGCGYGNTIRDLQAAGFTKIDATEHCPTRAAAVRDVFGINVTTDIPDKRYGLIVSHHVLEHCADPAALIRECAKRQESGDWMIHSLPAFQFEPKMGVLLFLPHLWSFNAATFAWTLLQCDYACRMNYSTRQVHIAAQRQELARFDVPRWEIAGFVSMLVDRLGLAATSFPRESVLAWRSGIDEVLWLPRTTKELPEGFTRHIVAERLTEGFETPAPIEIQFPERVQVFIK